MSPAMQSAGVVQPVGQLVEPLQTKGLQEGVPGLPVATGEHVPVAQVAHAPVQAVLQQTPATQKLCWHGLGMVQAVPSATAHWSSTPTGMCAQPKGHVASAVAAPPADEHW